MATVKAIKYGMKGDDVANLQTTLKNLGYNIDVDGSFGPQTLAAVKSYQQANGLDVDGMVGPQTMAALYGTSTKASSRPASSAPISAPSQPALDPDPTPSQPVMEPDALVSVSSPSSITEPIPPATSRPTTSAPISTPSQPASSSQPTLDPEPTPSQPVTEPDVLVPVSLPSSPISEPSQPATDPDPAPSIEPDMTPSIAPTSTPGAGSAGPTGTEVVYPDNFSYDDFTYEDYQSSGKVDKAVGDGFSYDNFSYADYAESETVQQANAALQAILAAQPGAYQSKWQSQIDDIINRILNREEFSYDVNEDALYQQYKDQYIQGGKLAMQDTMGQAAAMTGGYGNSYAASVGNQAYQNYLSKLNEVVPELYGMALDRYNMEGEEMYNQYGLLSSQEQQDYARYRDSYNDWLTERDYATGRYDSERDYDYGKYVDDRNFDYGVYVDDRAQKYSEYLNAIDLAKWQETDAYNKYLNDRNFDYGVYVDDRNQDYNEYLDAVQQAQFNANFYEGQRQYNDTMEFNTSSQERDYAYKTAMELLINGEMPSADLLAAAGISEADATAMINAAKALKLEESASEDRKYAFQFAMEVIASGQMPTVDLLTKAGIPEADAKTVVDAIQAEMQAKASSGSGKVSGSVTGEVAEEPMLTDTSKIDKWEDKILNAETEAEALAYAERLEKEDPALAYYLYEKWLREHGYYATGADTTVPGMSGGGVTSSHGSNSSRPNVMQ